jgi:hypothetical protein
LDTLPNDAGEGSLSLGEDTFAFIDLWIRVRSR